MSVQAWLWGRNLQSAEDITESLKSAAPMSWTQRMNNIAARAEEIIREELIYNG